MPFGAPWRGADADVWYCSSVRLLAVNGKPAEATAPKEAILCTYRQSGAGTPLAECSANASQDRGEADRGDFWNDGVEHPSEFSSSLGEDGDTNRSVGRCAPSVICRGRCAVGLSLGDGGRRDRPMWADGSYRNRDSCRRTVSIEPTASVETAGGLTGVRTPGRPPVRVLLAIGAGGMLGALARYEIGRRWPVG